MDLPTPVEQPVTDEATTAPLAREATLAELQAEIASLSRRVDALAGSLDTSVRSAVTEEVHRVAGELQHTVAALGRVLVRDLGRLNQILTQHRDVIIAEIRKPESSKGASRSDPAAEATGAPAGGGEADGGAEPAAAEGPSGPAGGGADDQGPDSGKGRNWRRRKA